MKKFIAVCSILLFLCDSFSQVEIKERVEINPGSSFNYTDEDSIYFDGCWYDVYDSSEIELRFTPEEIAPGQSTIMGLYTSGGNPYNEDIYDIIEKTIVIDPDCGSFSYLGDGEYLFTSPDTLTVDSIVITVNYENYNRFCRVSALNSKNTERLNNSSGCIECFPYQRELNRAYGSGEVTMKWDSLIVSVSPTELFPGDTADVVIKKRLYDGTLTDWDTSQTFEAAMLDGCVLGNILVADSLDAYFYDVNEPIKFIADTTVADSTEETSGIVLLRIGLVEDTLSENSRVQNDEINDYCFTGDLLTTKAAIVSTEVKEIKLIILEPTATTVDTFITDEPSMPELEVTAMLDGYSGGEFAFEWKYVLSWTNTAENPDRTIQKTFEGSEPGLLSTSTSWLIDWDEAIIGGDNDTLFVSAFTVPRVYKDTVINPFRILGTNPTPEEIRNGLTTHEQIVVYLETLPKWHHFNTNGFPIFGGPHGYGLMQLDNPTASDEQIWNWRANRTEGQQRLTGKYNRAVDFPNRTRTRYPGATDFTTDEQIWKETHQRYRGGSYWRWIPTDRFNPSGNGEWIASPSQSHTRGEEAWEIYEDIQSGNYPPNWN